MKQREVNISDDDIRECYNAHMSLHETASKLNATIVTIWRRASTIGLHWKDLSIKNNCVKIDLVDILSGEHPEYQTFKLHKRLIKEGIKEPKCEICGNSEWCGKPIPLQLDHIDGDSHNHVLENLRLICPNCHAQTETYCGKNKKSL